MELCNVGGSFWSDSLPVERASVWRLYLKTPCKAMRRCIGVIFFAVGDALYEEEAEEGSKEL